MAAANQKARLETHRGWAWCFMVVFGIAHHLLVFLLLALLFVGLAVMIRGP